MNGSWQSPPDPSATSSPSAEPFKRLDSWKEIASYLGRSEKTVRRWEATEGLPVHRLRHERGSSVYAYSGELEAWRQTRKAAQSPEFAADVAAEAPAQQTAASLSEEPASPAKVARLPRNWRIGGVLILVSLIALLAGLGWQRLVRFVSSGHAARIQSLAVLPFGNLSRDARQDYLAEGITEQLITELARASPVRVISRTSVMRYKNTIKPVLEIARELNVDALVEGTLQRYGDRVRMTVQLITPLPERHLWAESYEGDLHNILDLERDVAEDIRSKIQIRLAGRPSVSSKSGENPDARTYEDYLRGRYFLARRNATSMNKALEYFQEAVRRDPRYPPAYAGLAVAYDVLGSYEVLAPAESFPKAKAYANEAIRLDDTLPEAYTARAMATSCWDFDWSAAKRDFQRALALDPSYALAHHWYAETWIDVGKGDRAVAEMKKARELDPVSLPINGTLGRVFRDADRYEEALQQCQKTLDLDPHFAMGHWCLGQVYIGEHRYSAAIAELELAQSLGTTPLVTRDLGWAYAAVGNKVKARQIIEALKRTPPPSYFSPYSIAVIHAALGEKNTAFQWLERAYTERDSHFNYLALDPELDPLRSDPRFPPLLERLHIPH